VEGWRCSSKKKFIIQKYQEEEKRGKGEKGKVRKKGEQQVVRREKGTAWSSELKEMEIIDVFV